MKAKVSVAVATYNEAENIERCLKSVADWADEIVLVDGNSQDETVDIAKKFKAKIIETDNKPIFHINKQMAVDACKNGWVLALDADEEVTPALAKEIQQIITLDENSIRQRRENPANSQQHKKWNLFSRHQQLLEQRDGAFNQSAKETVAFFIPRSNMFLGHAMKHTGVYPDGVIRLFRKDKARFPCKSVHEQIEVDGRVDWLVSDLLHYDSPSFEKYMSRANRYTSLTAKKLLDENITVGIGSFFTYVLLKPVSVFLSLFIRHKGILDGFSGFVFSLMSGLHWAIAYMKYWDMVRLGSNEK